MGIGTGDCLGSARRQLRHVRTTAGASLLACLTAACFNPDGAAVVGDTDTDAAGSTGQPDPTLTTSSTTSSTTDDTVGTTTSSETSNTQTAATGDTSTGSRDTDEGSESSSTGEPVDPACGDGTVVATEVCYEVGDELAGASYRFGYLEDLDSDDDQDLIYSAANGEIVVQLNTDGVFGLATTSNFDGVSTLNQMSFTFIDDDDVLDGFLVSQSGGVVLTAFGNTSGDYAVAAGSGTEAYAVAMADMSGNGRDEAVVLVLAGIEVFAIGADGQLGQVEAVSFGDFSDQLDVEIADFNGDEQLDVLFLGDYDDGNQVRMYLGNGNGSLNTAGLPPFFNTEAARDLSIGDFDGDGENDIAVADGSTVGVVFGNGGLGFTEIDDINVDSGTTSRIEAADVDQDGIDDIVLGYSDRNALTIYLGSATRDFSAGEDVSIAHVTETLSTGDVNGDDVPDIVVTSAAAEALTVVRSAN